MAFSLYPVSIEKVMDIADAGEVMPPKSTWFEPKLRSGMVVRSIDAGEQLDARLCLKTSEQGNREQ
jgi:hypothetical protein